MSKYLPKPSLSVGLGAAIPTVLAANTARAQSNDSNPDSLPTESTAANANRQIQKALPIKPSGTNSTTLGIGGNGAASYTFVMSTPAMIAIAVVVGGLALFPVISILLSSKKAAKLGKESLLSKWSDKFRKPQILESDKFLHNRTIEKLAQITNQAENLNADKFGNTEFMTFFKIKSYIARSIDEYANLDETIEMLQVAIDAQNSFSQIDSTESRYCSSGQQKLYTFVNSLLAQEIDVSVFRTQVAQKLEEVLPLLQTEEGKVALQAYVVEINKISQHPLGLKLMLLFKKYQLDDYSTLRGVSNTLAQLDSEDLLNLDALLVLVMTKYDVFEKLGPIVGIDEQYNRPETYSKMLQYIGLKSRHESSYQKFQEFLLLLKQWEIHYRSVVNVRTKYSETEYRFPKEFHSEVPGLKIYQKYKDSFHLIAQAPKNDSDTAASKLAVSPQSGDSSAILPTLTVVPKAEDNETSPILTEVK
jgi:hypothetical protein